MTADGPGIFPLDGGWSLLGTAPGAIAGPADLPPPGPAWRDASAPGTVAQALQLGLEGADLDGQDWWYRCSFSASGGPGGARLRFAGLATLAEVWLNGTEILRSRNMHRSHAPDVAGLLRPENELVIAFRSVKAELRARRPRPRWKTALVETQDLRWLRTTLLGRIPGWTPPLPPVGPWRGIALDRGPLGEIALLPSIEEGVPRLRVAATAAGVTGAILRVGEREFPLSVEQKGGESRISGDLPLPDAPLWWPHTHGEPALLRCRAVLAVEGGEMEVDCGPVGFRSVAVERSGGQVTLVVNGRPVFCRGACWTVQDARSLDGAPGETARTLRLARDGGLNMIRIVGTMAYGSDELYRACDELGILVWQDLMLANMDYPSSDPEFRAEIEAEVAAQARRLSRHPSVAVYCGGSEVEQQAAMLGLPREEWSSPLFSEVLPRVLAADHPGVPYFPSTPCEGPLPFHTSVGLTHYYGVGAYRRPLSDARRAGVKFTPECLGFSHVPEPEMLERVLGGARPAPHHPAWKAGVPRDNGAGWDFEDVRDHYLRELFGVDPVSLRSADIERYYALSRVVTGELLLRVFAEWRRPGSGCGGALVWLLKDLRPGAGWGILDSDGAPKAAWWYLRRAWARRAVLITDEGLDGLGLHVLNERGEAWEGTVELELLRGGRHRVGHAQREVRVDAGGGITLSGDEMLGRFADLAYAYRFGPPGHDAVVARLREGDRVVSEDAVFPAGYGLKMQESPDLRAAVAAEDGAVVVTLESAALLQAVAISCRGYRPDDAYFHLSPGAPRAIRFAPEPGAKAFKATFSALNWEGTLTVRA